MSFPDIPPDPFNNLTPTPFVADIPAVPDASAVDPGIPDPVTEQDKAARADLAATTVGVPATVDGQHQGDWTSEPAPADDAETEPQPDMQAAKTSDPAQWVGRLAVAQRPEYPIGSAWHGAGPDGETSADAEKPGGDESVGPDGIKPYRVYGDYKCKPYLFSNDGWTRPAAQQLREALKAQPEHYRENGVWLGIGAGGMPYLPRHFKASTVVVADRSPDVIDFTVARMAAMSGPDNWQEYNGLVAGMLPVPIGDDDDGLLECLQREEYHTAMRAGLVGQFTIAKAAVAKVEVDWLCGDILQEAAALGKQLKREGRVVTGLNLTNLAEYVGETPAGGRRVLREEVVDVLKMAPRAVIIDSSPTSKRPPDDLVPKMYTLATYGR